MGILESKALALGVFPDGHYLIGSIAAFVIAGIMALLIRLELSAVGPTITSDPSQYNVWG